VEYKSVEQLAQVANVNPEAQQPPVMSQNERLQRWAELLENDPDRRLNTFFETEYQRPEARDAMRPGNTPISVALADPVLRAQGLADDSYGEARRLFDLSDHQLHHILCYCHHGATMSAETAARSIRGVIAALPRPGLVERMRQVLAT
jgi:hypothetical protein